MLVHVLTAGQLHPEEAHSFVAAALSLRTRWTPSHESQSMSHSADIRPTLLLLQSDDKEIQTDMATEARTEASLAWGGKDTEPGLGQAGQHLSSACHNTNK